MRVWLIVVGLSLIAITCLSIPTLSVAADKSGEYITGGGVGSVQCAQFVHDMDEARKAGGLRSPAGTNIISVWSEYVVGFQTGYNYAAPGVRDIFAPFGSSPSIDVLGKVDSWCQEHPSEIFGVALVNFVRTMEPKPKPIP